MTAPENTLRIFELCQSSTLRLDLQAFLLDARARNLSPGSIRFYQQKLEPLLDFLAGLHVSDSASVSSSHLRLWLVHLQEQDHTPGGVHCFYRAAKAFFSWMLREEIIERNPMKRVRSPRVPQENLAPVSMAEVRALHEVCDTKTLCGLRDRAILLCLLDSGCRASEFVALDLNDIDLKTGALFVRCGKGRKPRVTFLGAKSRRELLRYLRKRGQVAADAPLFARREGGRLTYSGLRDIVRRRARQAGIVSPSLHSFRRGFALEALRHGADIYSLQRMMGHASLTVLQRYLRQTQGDLQRIHERSSPVDHLL